MRCAESCALFVFWSLFPWYTFNWLPKPKLTLSRPTLSCCLYSTHPHGGNTFLGLLLATGAAFVATTYAVASCRFLVVSFESDTGHFEEYFVNEQQVDAGRNRLAYKAGVGLFKFLRPNDVADWSEGVCTGYQELMMDELADPVWGTARFFAVMAVMMAAVVLFWTAGTACFGLNQIQIVLLGVCCLLGCVSSGMTFLMGRSGMCQDLFLTRDCKIDEGGLVMIAGTILWFIAFLVSVVYMKEFLGFEDEEEELDVDKMSADEKERVLEEVAKQQAAGAAAVAAATPGGSAPGTPKTLPESPSSDPPGSGARPMLTRPRSGVQPVPRSRSGNAQPIPRSRSGNVQPMPPQRRSGAEPRPVAANLRRSGHPGRPSSVQPVPQRRSGNLQPMPPQRRSGAGHPNPVRRGKPKRSSPSRQRVVRNVERSGRPRQPPSQRVVTVDDISRKDALEVYISKRLDNIEQLAEV